MALKEKMLAFADQIRVMFSAEETESALEATVAEESAETATELADEPEAEAAPAADKPDEANSETKAVEEVSARVDELAAQVQSLTEALAAMQTERDQAQGERDSAQATATALRVELSKVQAEPADSKVNLSADKPAAKTLAQQRAAAAIASKNSR
ncbi:hypothetical protein Q5H93_06245 [Hymenobacter sp. ASUV-10]|uniref:Uncharacterized protein n=1 Tax=Hymenobacter aranciens TaxID=3063996 RepID=A0ABT9B7S7_9BACT|nr:hypothetical protein [Hymenobacter sp. ASUV-10]MDO7874326.1 hypothetical protein [Hymenobacter sp. ASUV-10]